MADAVDTSPLERIKSGHICTPQEIARNFSILKQYIQNITNIVNNTYLSGVLMADVEVVGGGCAPAGEDGVAQVTGYTPWYDPLDYPDIPSPVDTGVANRYGLPGGPGLAAWNPILEEWRLVQTTHSAASWVMGPLTLDGQTLSWGLGGGMVAGGCDGGIDSLTFPLEDIDVLYSVSKSELGASCSLTRKRATFKVFGQPQAVGAEETIWSFEPIDVLTDVALAGDIVGSYVQLLVPCYNTGATEVLIPTASCTTASAGTSP